MKWINWLNLMWAIVLSVLSILSFARGNTYIGILDAVIAALNASVFLIAVASCRKHRKKYNRSLSLMELEDHVEK